MPEANGLGVDWQCVDLRKRAAREMVECLASRSAVLEPRERALVQAHYIQGIPAERIAWLMGCSPEAARRRLRILTARVSSDRFAFVLARRGAWTPMRRKVSTLCFLQGRTMRAAARRLGTSLHTVRRHCEAVMAEWGARSEQ